MKEMRCAYPAVVPAVDIPLHQVAIPLWKVGLETVGLGDLGAFLIAGLFMVLVVTVLGVELLKRLARAADGQQWSCSGVAYQVCKFADLVPGAWSVLDS